MTQEEVKDAGHLAERALEQLLPGPKVIGVRPCQPLSWLAATEAFERS